MFQTRDVLIRPTSDEKLLRTLFRLAVSSSLKVYKNGPRKLPLFVRTCFNFTCLLAHEIPRRPVILPFSLKFPYGRESAAHQVVSTVFSIIPTYPQCNPNITPFYTLEPLGCRYTRDVGFSHLHVGFERNPLDAS